MVDELTITYVISKSTDATVWPFEPSFRVQTRTGEQVATVFIVVSDLVARTRLLPRLADRQDPDAALREALLRWSVSRLERALADPLARRALLDQPRRSWRIGDADPGEVDDLLALVGANKACTHQRAEGRDLLCLAASSKDKTAIGTVGWLRVAPTSRPLCAACQMPDAAVVCSHFSHPEVSGLTSMGGVSRQLDGVLCNLGRTEIQQPGRLPRRRSSVLAAGGCAGDGSADGAHAPARAGGDP